MQLGIPIWRTANPLRCVRRIGWDTRTKSLSGILMYLLVVKTMVYVPENSFTSHTTHYTSPKHEIKGKVQNLKTQRCWPVSLSIQNIPCRPWRHLTDQLWKEQMTGNSSRHLWVGKTIYGCFNNDRIRLVYHMSEIAKREVYFVGKVFIFHWAFTLPFLSDLTGYCNSFWCAAAPCQRNK